VYQDVNTDVTYGNMYFTQNVARNGGAVFLAQGATATFQVGSITRNRATVRLFRYLPFVVSCTAVDWLLFPQQVAKRTAREHCQCPNSFSV
jgi:predicted outer membrane repeat protein